MIWLLLKVAIRFAVFSGVFAFAAHKSEKVTIQPKYALPWVALVLAVLNTGLYGLAKPVLNLATFGTLWFAMPFVINGLFLYATDRLLKPLKVEGVATLAWLAAILTAAHGVLYLVFDALGGRWS